MSPEHPLGPPKEPSIEETMGRLGQDKVTKSAGDIVF